MSDKMIYLKTTETCNLDCPHCFTSGSNGRKVFWNVEKVKKWLSNLNDYQPKEESFNIALHGGEPFICKMKDLIDVAEHIHTFDREVELTISTNLVYKLTDERLDFIKKYIRGVATSWDITGRFQTPEQLALWEKNIATLLKISDDPEFVRVHTVLSKELIQFGVERYIKEVIDKNNIRYFTIEKITPHGSAKVNSKEIIPSNKDANDFIYSLHRYITDNNLRDKYQIDCLRDIYDKVEKRLSNQGMYSRHCEESIYTVNADGTVSGCPNDAPNIHYGNISQDMDKIHHSPKRMIQIHKEVVLNDECYSCDLLEYCGGGCYKLHWDDTGCPTPKQLILDLIKDN
jgi:radical SAM additional 4Fe4S-binding domain|nr:MAG TPA: putative Fe-S oxidoreductase [Caudoviricetes sp.]